MTDELELESAAVFQAPLECKANLGYNLRPQADRAGSGGEAVFAPTTGLPSCSKESGNYRTDPPVWDYFGVPTDSDGGWRSLRLDILSPAADGRQLPTLIPAPNTKNFAFYESDNRYFMPRLGLAYRVTDKWVVRSGFGWFANAQQLNNFTILNLLPPRSGTFGFNQVTD